MAAKPRGKKGLVIGLVVFVVFLAVGGGVGFAMFKGLGPFAKKSAKPAPEKPKIATRRPAPKPPEAASRVRVIPPTTKLDPAEGAARLAKLWNELESDKLLAIAKDWKDPELARVAARMDPGKVAEILAAMPPRRASSLSREMQRVASVVPVE